MSTHSNTTNHEQEYDPTVWVPEQHSHGTKDIWIKFWILTGITLVDIVFYFTMDPSMFRNIIFICLGIVKAFYIVGTFMHLKHERLNLILTILLPIFFIIFFIVWMLHEGSIWAGHN